MRCDSGRLQSYLDGDLEGAQRAALEAHLARCPECQAALGEMRQRALAVEERLSALDSEPLPSSRTDVALARLQRRIQAQDTAFAGTLRGRFEMFGRKVSRQWRPAAIGLVALALLVGLFSIGPVREAAAEFLGVFRVRKFAVIPVDQAALERLEQAEGLLDSGVLGEPTVVREPGPYQVVADVAAASAAAGFAVAAPEYLPKDPALREVAVEPGPRVEMTVDGATASGMLQALGVEDVELPEGQLPFSADFGAVVYQEYRAATGSWMLRLVQMPSPTVIYPGELDPAVIGEAGLRALGLPEEDVRRLAQAIDWTSTFVIPLPTNQATYHEVEVSGVAGLMVEQQVNSSRPPDAVLLWQKEGLVYALQAQNVSAREVLRVADSIR
ncbi:MAG: hypothetical protein GXY76_00410 [Chloroflexi bacterium]|nr:hypothetical protein [Chloroflexota bacterium]